jgi:hypothetical protein
MASGQLARMYDKWFMKPIPPQNTAVNLPMGTTLKALIAKPNDLPAESYSKTLEGPRPISTRDLASIEVPVPAYHHSNDACVHCLPSSMQSDWLLAFEG